MTSIWSWPHLQIVKSWQHWVLNLWTAATYWPLSNGCKHWNFVSLKFILLLSEGFGFRDKSLGLLLCYSMLFWYIEPGVDRIYLSRHPQSLHQSQDGHIILVPCCAKQSHWLQLERPETKPKGLQFLVFFLKHLGGLVQLLRKTQTLVGW